MKHLTIDVLKLQMEEKKDGERRQRELEMQQYNEHLERSVALPTTKGNLIMCISEETARDSTAKVT